MSKLDDQAKAEITGLGAICRLMLVVAGLWAAWDLWSIYSATMAVHERATSGVGRYVAQQYGANRLFVESVKWALILGVLLVLCKLTPPKPKR